MTRDEVTPMPDQTLPDKSNSLARTVDMIRYLPRDPAAYRPKIGMIGMGMISQYHLKAYQAAGYDVVALCDVIRERAVERRDAFYPSAVVTTDYREILARDDIQVVDIATHPAERVSVIREALNARKHVLSQKPFVLDLAVGEELVTLAQQQGVKLAVNQNGRWAPHFSFIREVVKAGVIGDVLCIRQGVHWDSTWVAGTPFEDIEDMILYDFAIHYFDFIASLIGDKATRVQASRSHAASQTVKPPMLNQVIIEFKGGQASLSFDAQILHGSLDHTLVGGSKGTIVSRGPYLGEQKITLYAEGEEVSPELVGTWFDNGFHGTMAELLCAVEENREPLNGAAANLNSLALGFAAIAAAHSHGSVVPGEERRIRS